MKKKSWIFTQRMRDFLYQSGTIGFWGHPHLFSVAGIKLGTLKFFGFSLNASPKKTQQIDVFGDTLSIMNGQAWKKRRKIQMAETPVVNGHICSHVGFGWIPLTRWGNLHLEITTKKHFSNPLPAPHLLHHLRHLEKRLLDEWCFGSCCFFFWDVLQVSDLENSKKGYEKALNLTNPKAWNGFFTAETCEFLHH